MLKLISFIILRILSNPIANVFQKKLSCNNSSLTINLYSYLFLSIISLPLLKGVTFSNYNISFWLTVFIAGLLCSLGTLCSIKAVSIGELSVMGPINSYKCVIGFLASLFLLKEIPSILGFIGMALIVWGSKFMFEDYNEGFSIKLFKRKDIQYRLLALLLTGTEAAMLKKIIILSSVKICFILWCLVGLFWTIIFICITRKKYKLNANKELAECVLIAICLGIMQYSTNYVFKYVNVGCALALFQLSSVVTVVFGYKIFHEQNLIKKLIGSAIMILGSCCILIK